VSGRTALERRVEAVLTTGLLASGLLLVVGLLLGRTALLHWGILLLMLTPVARVVVVTAALFVERDWLFGLVSLWILAVLVSSLWLAFSGGTAGPGDAGPTPRPGG
jgi:uncharacterized membrane protein